MSSVSFCSSADLLSASSWDGTVRLWDLQRGLHSAEHVATYRHASPALCTAWSPQGEIVYSGGGDHAVRAFQLGSGHLSLLGEHAAPVSSLRTSGEHPSCVFSASWDKTLVCWDSRTSAKVTSITLNERVYSLDVQWPIAALTTSAAGEVVLIDMRMKVPEPKRTPVIQQISRCPPRSLALFPTALDRSGFCVGSYESRVGVHFLPGPDGGGKSSVGSNDKWGGVWPPSPPHTTDARDPSSRPAPPSSSQPSRAG